MVINMKNIKRKIIRNKRKIISYQLNSLDHINQFSIFKLIKFGIPSRNGVYLIYYEPDPARVDSKTKPAAGVKVVNFHNGEWGSGDRIIAYVGPLPNLNLKMLKKDKLIDQIFYIGSIKQAKTDKFKIGPFPVYILAFLQPAATDNFIFCIDSDFNFPYPVSFCKKREDGVFVWKPLSKRAVQKYKKLMKS